ncbi:MULTISPECIES: DNA internalization-related competence protein ComEC/Rec2 [unclassified Microbulbifer]|uniref:DNA internalization-related competence protein ComEC/Rec2 n=1 Tax=unclassified Microbulbifer TaxID=2619833 RepID=UPI0027E506E6|nr:MULTISPECIES: DNA internalization-related competence protein ComEC/Rec2 [unclassified Microbulbifer]
MQWAAGARTAEERNSLSLTLLLWSYALAIAAVGCLPRIPPPIFLAALAAALLCCALLLPSRRRLVPLLLAVFAGAGWGSWHNRQALEERLPLSAHGADFLLQLEVVSLPESRVSALRDGDSEAAVNLRFSARVLGQLDGGELSSPPQGQLLDLTWYRADAEVRRQLRAGSRWNLPVRLKRPRGSVNPHGFDYEGWLLRRGVYATGYVRPGDHTPQFLDSFKGLPAMRHWLRDRLVEQPARRPELLRALLLGDRSGLDSDDRRLLRETGTAHLLAISGLHVGMVAGFFLLIGNLLGRLMGAVTGISFFTPAVFLALAGSLGYTLLAGTPLSAQRALAMTWVLLLAWQWRRRIGPGLAYSLALALVLTLQPLAFFGAGFWLSFIAVGALLLAFSHRVRLRRDAEDTEPGYARRIGRGFAGLLFSQWVVTLALLLPSLVFFSGFSLAGMLMNLVAIPWLGLLILPMLLLGTLLIWTPVGGWFIGFAGWQLDLLMGFLEQGRSLLPAWQTLALPLGTFGLFLAALGVLLLLLPAGLPGRRLGWLFLLPPLLPFLPQVNGEDDLRVTVLDVGQGLAVVLRTRQQRLLYDTGPLSGSGWSAGSQIIAPYLLGEGIPALDTVVVSHGDRDHAGGLVGLVETVPPGRVIAPGLLADRFNNFPQRMTANCRAGEKETLGDLNLLWLWPEDGEVSGEENDHSCVALVEWRGVRLLLAGDISSGVEQQLALRYPDLAPVDFLLAPHHGSRSSSSAAFIRWAQPANVIFSAGFRHHFGHPHPEVVERYRDAGARIWNTASSGAVTFSWSGAKEPRISLARDAGRFWYRKSADK